MWQPTMTTLVRSVRTSLPSLDKLLQAALSYSVLTSNVNSCKVTIAYPFSNRTSINAQLFSYLLSSINFLLHPFISLHRSLFLILAGMVKATHKYARLDTGMLMIIIDCRGTYKHL